MVINMKNCREAKGISVGELSEKVNIAKQTLWAYERGERNPTPEVLCAIADALDVSLDMLVRGKEKNRPEGRSIDDMVKIFNGLSREELDVLLSLGALLRYRREYPEQSGRDSKGNV